jgi:hypothetical protein
MKKALIIISVLGVLSVGCVLVVGVLGFVGYRNTNPSLNPEDVPASVGNFTFRRAFPPKGNIWGTEQSYFVEYENKTGNAVKGLTYSLRKFRSESAAAADFTSNPCKAGETEVKGALKNKGGETVGEFRKCGGVLNFRNRTRSVTVYDFMLVSESLTAEDGDLVEFAGQLPFNADLDMKSFTETDTAAGNVLSAAELAKQSDESKDSVNQYIGREITVRGYILITPTVTDPTYGGLSTLGDKDDLSAKKVSRWFEAQDVETFKALPGKQYITVKGVFKGDFSAELRPCKLVRAE